MKPIAIFVLVAVVVVTVAASAKTGAAPGNSDERVIAQVVGPAVGGRDIRAASCGRTATCSEKSEVKAKPPLRDSH